MLLLLHKLKRLLAILDIALIITPVLRPVATRPFSLSAVPASLLAAPPSALAFEAACNASRVMYARGGRESDGCLSVRMR